MALFSDNSTTKKYLPFIALLFLGFLIYSNVLNGEFVSDDTTYIVTNIAVKDIGDLKTIWESFNARFLPGLTFALNYELGGLNVFGYHFFNILIHVFASFLVYKFVRLTFETPALKNIALAKESGSVALLSSLIFLCHPIQTQGVAFITQRSTSMATSCYVLILIFYILARLRSKKRYYFAALGVLMIGMFCKENIITIPVTICVYELFFFKEDGQERWRRFRPALLFFSSWLLLPLILMQDRPTSVLGLKNEVLSSSIDPNYFFTEINVLRTYLRLLFLPVNQIHEYDYPLAQGFWEPSTLYSVCLLATLLGLAYYLYSRSKVSSFCILWFFITTSVEFAVVSIVNKNLIYEHWLYLPMVGFSLFLSYIMHAFFKSRGRLRMAAVLLIALMASATYQRNKVWQNEIGFWQDVLRKSPGRPAAHFAMGRAWDNRGYEELAVQEYHKALAINPSDDRTLNNLGGVYLSRGDYKKAMELFKRTLGAGTEYPMAYNNIAYVYYLEGNDKEAIRYYKKSLARQVPYPEAYLYMGHSYLELGRKKEAKESFTKAIQLYQKYDKPQKARDTALLVERIQ